MKKIIILISIIFIGGCSNMSTATINKVKSNSIPLEDFFRNPDKTSFQLSPKGGFISYMKPWEEGNRRMNIYVKKMNSNEEVRLTSEENRGIYGYLWLSENRIAYAKDEGGDENVHIFAINVDGTNEIDLTPF